MRTFIVNNPIESAIIFVGAIALLYYIFVGRKNNVVASTTDTASASSGTGTGLANRFTSPTSSAIGKETPTL